MLQALTIQDIFDWNKYYKTQTHLSGDYYRPSEESKMYAAFHYLLDYYFFRENCARALQKLQQICTADNFLETTGVKEWTISHEWLGAKKLVAFLVDNNIHEKESVLKLASLNIGIELQPFMPLVVFCEVFRILYFELQLHLPERERKVDPAGQHYSQHDPVPPATRVKEWLRKIA